MTVNPAPGARKSNEVVQSAPEADAIITYPNPAHDVVTVRLSNKLEGKMFIQVYDVKGVLRKSEYLQKTNVVLQRTINVSDMENGIYYIRVSVNGKAYSVKIVKQ